MTDSIITRRHVAVAATVVAAALVGSVVAVVARRHFINKHPIRTLPIDSSDGWYHILPMPLPILPPRN